MLPWKSVKETGDSGSGRRSGRVVLVDSNFRRSFRKMLLYLQKIPQTHTRTYISLVALLYVCVEDVYISLPSSVFVK